MTFEVQKSTFKFFEHSRIGKRRNSIPLRFETNSCSAFFADRSESFAPLHISLKLDTFAGIFPISKCD